MKNSRIMSLGSPLIAHHETVTRDATVGPDQEQVAEPPSWQGIVDDLAVHFPAVQLAQWEDIIQRHGRDIDGHRTIPAQCVSVRLDTDGKDTGLARGGQGCRRKQAGRLWIQGRPGFTAIVITRFDTISSEMRSSLTVHTVCRRAFARWRHFPDWRLRCSVIESN